MTFEFSRPRYTREALNDVVDLVLIDRGGFTNLNKTYPKYANTNTQRNPRLWDRAYKGAWINNAMFMAFMNVTNLKNTSDPDSRAFTFLNSHVGKRFSLMRKNSGIVSPIANTLGANGFWTSPFHGRYLWGLDGGIESWNVSLSNNTNTTIPGEKPLYENPYNITGDDLTSAGKVLMSFGVFRLD